MTVNSRTLKTLPDDVDGPTWDRSSSCGYRSALLRWLTGDFTRPAKHQQSVAVRVDAPPPHVDGDNDVMPEIGGRLSDHEANDAPRDADKMKHVAVESFVSVEDRNETLVAGFTAGQSAGIVATTTTKLDVTYTATAEVLAVLE